MLALTGTSGCVPRTANLTLTANLSARSLWHSSQISGKPETIWLRRHKDCCAGRGCNSTLPHPAQMLFAESPLQFGRLQSTLKAPPSVEGDWLRQEHTLQTLELGKGSIERPPECAS